MPTTAWYDERRGAGRWNQGAVVINLSIGQGEMLVTPLQLASLAATVGMRGRIQTPHFLMATRDPESSGETGVAATRRKPLILARQHWDAVIGAMEKTIDSGTGGRCRIAGVRVAGKTGTVQNPHGDDHAVFIAFAPVEDPRIAVSVIVENGGHGGSVAAPIARRAILTALGMADATTVARPRLAVRDSLVEVQN